MLQMGVRVTVRKERGLRFTQRNSPRDIAVGTNQSMCVSRTCRKIMNRPLGRSAELTLDRDGSFDVADPVNHRNQCVAIEKD